MINIVYFGTSDHSVILLSEILRSSAAKISLVITKPDKPLGREKVISPTPVKAWCEQNRVPVVTPASLKNELNSVIESIKAHCDPDASQTVGLVADYGLIIPEALINIFKNGIVNVHFSLLPKYRGASPVAYTILNGEEQAGITFQKMVYEMDRGDIIKQIRFQITQKENDETLYQKLFKVAAESVLEVLEGYLSGDVRPQKQIEIDATYTTPSGTLDRTTLIEKEDAKLDFSKSPIELERTIRAYYPWPVAWTTVSDLASFLNSKVRGDNENLRVKIHSATLDESGNLVFDQVQVEGKNVVNFEDFKNGYLV